TVTPATRIAPLPRPRRRTSGGIFSGRCKRGASSSSEIGGGSFSSATCSNCRYSPQCGHLIGWPGRVSAKCKRFPHVHVSCMTRPRVANGATRNCCVLLVSHHALWPRPETNTTRFMWWVRLISPRLRFGLVCPYQPEAQARRLETDPPPRFNLPAHLAAIAPD